MYVVLEFVPAITNITSLPTYSTVPGSIVILKSGPLTVPVPTSSSPIYASITFNSGGADNTDPKITLPVKKAGAADAGTGVGVA